MATVRMVVRESGTGDPLESVDVQVRTLVGDSLLDTLSTDANGEVTYEADGSPGPLVLVTDYGTTVRKTSGQNLDQVGTYYLADVPRLLSLLGDGVIAGYTDRDTLANDLAASPGTGRRVNVASGAVLIDGIMGRFTATTAVDIAENTSGATRYDLVVADLTRADESEEGAFAITAVTGTSTVTGPALTKTNATRQVAIALIRVVDGATSFVSGDITDLRYSPSHDQAYVQLNPNAFARSASYENGDILMVTGGKLDRLAKGTDGQALVLASGLPSWGSLTLFVTVQEGDVTVDAAVTTLDFDATDFNVTSTPTGEANIALAYGTTAGTPAQGNHTHTGVYAASAHTHTVAALTDLTASAAELNTLNGITPDVTELNYVNGVTSPIQTQLDAKAAASHTHSSFQNFDVRAKRDVVVEGSNLSITSTTSQDVLSDTQALSANVTYDIFVTGNAQLSAGAGGSISAAITISGSVSGTLWAADWIGVLTEGGERSVMPYGVALAVDGGQTITVKLVAKRATANGAIASASFFGQCIARGTGGVSS